jgi:non-ribosomal peptide synthetase component F/acyl carrier protein
MTTTGPASFVQQGIWLNELRTEMHDAYHLSFTLSFDGELDIASLLTACTAVISRHGVLAGAFGDREGSAYVRQADRAPRVERADLSGVPSGQRESELRDQIERSIRRPFDLRRGPLVRMTLYTLGRSRHVLLLVAHHIVFDGQSMEIFVRDLLRLYGAAATGCDPALPELQHPASDYASAEECRVAGLLADARRFWRERWVEPQQLLLPGVTRPIRSVDAGEHVEFTIEGSARAQLSNAAHDLDITEFDLLLASLHCLLYRYGNDLPVVTIALGLRPAEYQENIGSFAHELPSAPSLSPGTAFGRFAETLHASLRELYQYRMVPLSHAMAGVSPSALHTAVALSYLPVKGSTQLPGLQVDVARMPNAWVRGALSILVHAQDSALRFIIRYPSRALTRDGAQRIADHWRHVIEQVTANPEIRIGTLSLLGAAEREQILSSRGAGRAVSRSGTVLDLVAEQASRQPDLIAARDGTAEITYGDLRAATEGLAQRIACLGLARGSVIAIRTHRPIARLTGLLAVLRSGNTCLVADRRACDQGIAAVLVEPCELDRPEFSNVTTVRLDSRGCACGTCETAAVVWPRPEEKAFATCSSRPGLTEYDHRALSNGLRSLADVLSLQPGDRWLSLCGVSSASSASSAGGPLGLLLPIVSGAQAVVASADDADNGPRLLALMARHNVTHIQATPSIWQRLLDAGFDMPDVVALSGGEDLQLSLARRLRRRVRQLWNVYGADGAAAWSTCAEVPPEADGMTIGRPMANTRVYVLDDFGAPAPAGAAGELFIAGHGLALGHAGQPAATAARFLPDPFGAPGERMLRTGDRARRRPDAEIELLGAADRRVRLRGHDAELADIEGRLGAHPALARCAVLARDEDDGGRSLVAYVATSAASRPSDAEFDTWLADVLPDAVRMEYVDVDDFPLADDGTLDTGRLRELSQRDDTRLTGPESDLAADAEVEEVRQIWRDVLKVGDIGIRDNLFDYRVDSLAVIRISSAIYRKMGIDIPLETFYDSPTILDISSIIAHARREGLIDNA